MFTLKLDYVYSEIPETDYVYPRIGKQFMRCGDEGKDRWISPKQYAPSIFSKLGASKGHDHRR